MRKKIAKYGLTASAAALAGVLSMVTASAESGSGTTSSSSGGMIGSLIMMVLLFAVMYFILIRPQKKKEKEQQAMQRAVRIGDEIVTIGGIVGLVTRVEDDTIQIETGGDRHKMRLKTWAIQENVTVKEDNERAKAAAAEEAKAKKEEKKKKKDADAAEEQGVLKD